MKRSLARAAIVVLALLAGGASVWEGSAVIGGAGDFPGEGLYGACNSFPRDTPVEVRNLETGKVITVIISRTVDNPGVFIALSPKAAAELGMRSGAAARVRAVALSVAQASGAMPVARAGESSDPDLNPKVFVARDKAAAAARTTSASSAAPAPAPAPAVAPAPPAVAAAVSNAQPAPAQPVVQPAAAQPIAETPAPTAPVAPAPAVAATTVAATPLAEAAPIAMEKPVADPYPVEVPEISLPGEPRPEPVALALPVPDQVPLPVQASVPTAHAFPAQAAESYGGSLLKPRKSGAVRIALPEPAIPVVAVAAATTPDAPVAPLIEKPKLDYLGAPKPADTSIAAGLPEPLPQPDELPEAVLSRIIAPRSEFIASVMDEAAAPAGEGPERSAEALALQRPTVSEGQDLPELAEPMEIAGTQAAIPEGPEAIAFERPRLRPTAPDLALVAPIPAEVALLGPEATVLERPSAGAEPGGVELADAEAPSPQELVAAERPLPQAGEQLAELGEPGYPAPPVSAEAIAENRLTAEPAMVAALTDPEPPSPLESLSPEIPAKSGASELLAILDEPAGIEPAIEEPQPIVAEEPAVEVAQAPEELPIPQEPVPAESVAVERPLPAEPASPVEESLEVPAVALAEPSEPAQSAPPAESAPDTPLVQPEPAVAIAESSAPAETEISLEPTSPRPPAETPATAPEPAPAVARVTAPEAAAAPVAPMPAPVQPPVAPAAPAPAAPAPAPTSPASAMAAVQLPESVAAVAALAKGSYYVQIGVYGTSDSLRTAVGGFVPVYPVAAEKVAVKGADAYRLYIGPLTRDESGVVLMRIKALGYKDAFVKKGS